MLESLERFLFVDIWRNFPQNYYPDNVSLIGCNSDVLEADIIQSGQYKKRTPYEVDDLQSVDHTNRAPYQYFTNLKRINCINMFIFYFFFSLKTVSFGKRSSSRTFQRIRSRAAYSNAASHPSSRLQVSEYTDDVIFYLITFFSFWYTCINGKNISF